jgi:hypothetical protein
MYVRVLWRVCSNDETEDHDIVGENVTTTKHRFESRWPRSVWEQHLHCDAAPNPAEEGKSQAVRRRRITPETQTPGAPVAVRLGGSDDDCCVRRT